MFRQAGLFRNDSINEYRDYGRLGNARAITFNKRLFYPFRHDTNPVSGRQDDIGDSPTPTIQYRHTHPRTSPVTSFYKPRGEKISMHLDVEFRVRSADCPHGCEPVFKRVLCGNDFNSMSKN